MKAPADGPVRWARSSLWPILISLLVFFLIQQFIVSPMATRAAGISYSQFKAELRSGNLQAVTVGKDQIAGTLKDGKQFNVVVVPDPDLTRELEAAGVEHKEAH